jgi:hypothetical protein
MSQRWSEYKRRQNDCYETPAWVTEALVPFLPNTDDDILDPASGGGKIVQALRKCGLKAYGNDIAKRRGYDFLKKADICSSAIVTNPPYNQAAEFIARALDITEPDGYVAMLLRTDFDHAQTRKYLFEHPVFSKKIVLTRRIVWFERKGAAPSFNHAWFLWDWDHQGPPTLAYV